ncbi:MAG: YgaP family membrane protein [Syntrophobacteraceae bacterium]
MNVDRLVFRFAGCFILISLLLSYFWSHQWLWLTAFVGANLIQASFTGFCPMAKLFKALGIKSGEAFH